MEKINKPRIVFMGTPDFAAHILSHLLEKKHQIISVYTQEDKRIGRKQILEKTAVKKVAEENNLEIFEPKKFDKETILKLQEQIPDLIIVAAYGKILPKEVLEIPKFGAINIHPSFLPKYRGASPIQNTLLNGEKETAVTIILIEEKVDAGKILVQEKVKIEDNETYPKLSQKLSKISAEILEKTISPWLEGKINPIAQNDSLATFCQIIKKEDGKINWSDTAQNIYNQYRAFYSWPGVFTYWKKEEREWRLKLNKIKSDSSEIENNFKIGEIFLENDQIKIKTGKGNIILEEIQLEGKNKMSGADFIRGYPQFIESVLK